MQSEGAQPEACAAGIYVSITGPPKIIKAAPEWLDMFGLEARACLGRTLNAVAGPESDMQRLKEMVEAVRNGRQASGRTVFYTARGEKALYSLRAKPARGLGGMQVCKLTMQKSDALSYKTAAADDGSCKVVLGLEKPYRIMSTSDGFERKYGFAREESANRTLGLIQGPETDVRGWLALVEGAQAGRSQAGTMKTYARDGTALCESVRVAPVLGRADIEFVVVTFGQDATNSNRPEAGCEKAYGAATRPAMDVELPLHAVGSCADENAERQRSTRSVRPRRHVERADDAMHEGKHGQHVPKRPAQRMAALQADMLKMYEDCKLVGAIVEVSPASNCRLGWTTNDDMFDHDAPRTRGAAQRIHRVGRTRSRSASPSRTDSKAKDGRRWHGGRGIFRTHERSSSPRVSMGDVKKMIQLKARVRRVERAKEAAVESAYPRVIEIVMWLLMSVAVALHLAPPPTDLQFDGDARKRKTYSKTWKRIHDMDMSASELELFSPY